MTILEVTAVPFTPAHRGGGESYPWRLARALAEHEDVLSCFSSEAPVPASEHPCRTIPGWFLDAPPFFSPQNPLPTGRSGRAMVEAIVGSAGPVEFVHVHNLRTAMSTAWLLLARRLKARYRFKVLLTDHNARWFPMPWLTAGAVDYFVAVSKESEAYLTSLARRPSVIVPTGIPSDYPGLLRPSRPWETRTVDLAYFGRLVPWKRPDLVLRLARDLKEPGAAAPRVLIAGSNVDPAYTAWLHDEARRLGLTESVEFVLDPSDEEASLLLSRAKVHLLLSARVDAMGRSHGSPELCPTTVIEAAACGTPSICSEVPGAHTQIVEGRTGFVTSLASWDQLVGQARRLLDAPEAWRVMSAEARDFAAKERTYGVLAKHLSDFLDLSRKGRV